MRKIGGPAPHMLTDYRKTDFLRTSSLTALRGLRRSRLAPVLPPAESHVRQRRIPDLHMPTSKVPTGAEQTKC